jgi:hypothetical protein
MNNISNTFDWIKHINQLKTPVGQFSNADWDLFNSYVIHKVLSMNPNFIELVNEVQLLSPTNKRQIYSIYKEYIPKNNKWSKYIKSTNKEPNKDLVEHLKNYFKVSTREIKDYLKILNKQEIQTILNKQGLEEKEIKILLK